MYKSQTSQLQLQSQSQTQLPFPLTTLKTASKQLQSRPTSDLLAVIEHLSRSLDRLQTENTALKKGGSGKYEGLVREVKRFRKESEGLWCVKKEVEEGVKKISRYNNCLTVFTFLTKPGTNIESNKKTPNSDTACP